MVPIWKKIWARVSMLMVSTPGPKALQLKKMTPQANKATNSNTNFRLDSINIALNK
jgi:hypothetical protein